MHVDEVLAVIPPYLRECTLSFQRRTLKHMFYTLGSEANHVVTVPHDRAVESLYRAHGSLQTFIDRSDNHSACEGCALRCMRALLPAASFLEAFATSRQLR